MGVPENRKLQAFIFVYLLFITAVPDNPSNYRLLVDTVGCMLSLLSLLFLELYLNSRPLNQKNILNSLQHLVLYCQVVYSARFWIVSAAGSMFRNLTLSFLEAYPRLFVALLLPRPYTISLETAYLAVSVSKLILVISPAMFQNLSSRKWFWISTILTLVCPMLDMIVNKLKCKHYIGATDNKFEHTMIFRQELGILNSTSGGEKRNATNPTLQSVGLSGEESLCYLFPTPGLLCFLILVLEFIRPMSAIIKESRKRSNKPRKTGGIPLPTSDNIQRLQEPSSNCSIPQLVGTTREVVLSPEDLESNITANTRTIIHVRAAIQTDEATTLDEEASSTIADPDSSTEQHEDQNEEIVGRVKESTSEHTGKGTLFESIRTTLRLFLFRTGTLSFVLFLLCYIVGIPIYVKNNALKLPIFSELFGFL